MACGIDEYVVRLDVSMDVVHFMHILNSQNELTDIKFGLLLRKDVFLNK